MVLTSECSHLEFLLLQLGILIMAATIIMSGVILFVRLVTLVIIGVILVILVAILFKTLFKLQ